MSLCFSGVAGYSMMMMLCEMCWHLICTTSQRSFARSSLFFPLIKIKALRDERDVKRLFCEGWRVKRQKTFSVDIIPDIRSRKVKTDFWIECNQSYFLDVQVRKYLVRGVLIRYY
jgi:hypothetical protein